MNEQLQNALSTILSRTVAGLDAGAQFLAAELPEVIQQLLVWKAAEAGIKLAFLSAVLVLALWAIRATVRAYNDGKEWAHDCGPSMAALLIGVFSGIGAAVSVLVIPSQIAVIVQIWLAPKIFLIEYAAGLAK